MIISGRFQGCKNRISLLGMILIFGVKQPLQINLSVRPRIRLPVRYNSWLAERVSLPGPRVCDFSFRSSINFGIEESLGA